jgi:hypothetical protein
MKTLEAKPVTVEEIQAAVLRLPRAEATRLAAWFVERDAALWDQQIEADAASGRLDAVWSVAEADIAAGRVRPLDELLDDR